MLTTYNECIPLISQLNHQDKLRLMQFLLTEFAREESINLQAVSNDADKIISADTGFALLKSNRPAVPADFDPASLLKPRWG